MLIIVREQGQKLIGGRDIGAVLRHHDRGTSGMGSICGSKKLLLIGLLIICISSLFGTTAKAESDGQAQFGDVEERIACIENGLKPLVVVKNRPERGFRLLDRLRHYNVAGVSIAVISGGELEWARGYGIADKETGRLVNAETLFRAASISKPVTAVAALRLVASGILNLDSPVNRQLTSWQIPENKFTDRQDVTLRHLLSHSGGLTDDPDLSYQHDQVIPTLIQVLDGTAPARSAPVRVDTIPGVTYKYSNQGYCIVQLMMSDMTGQPFSVLMDELVLQPVGMTSSTFQQNLPREFLARITTGYRSTGEELPGKWLVSPAMAAAGLWSTPSDLARLALAIMHSSSGSEKSLLSREHVADMLKVQAGQYGLGFRLEGTGDDLCFKHGGASDGYRCIMLAWPARGEGAVIMTNGDAGQGLYHEILRAIASEYGWPGYLPIEKTVVHLEQDRMKKFESVYMLDGRVELRFSVEEDHLRMDTASNFYTLYPESNTKFFDIDFGFTIDFGKDDTGAGKTAVMDRGGVLSTLSRIE